MAGNKGRFTKGDPRINRKGRPKSFDAARELAQAIAHEKARMKTGDAYVIDGHAVTYIEAILRNWAMSGDVQKQKAFVEYAYGKVPNPVEMTGKDGEAIEVKRIELTDDERAVRIDALLNQARTRRDGQVGNVERPADNADISDAI